MIRRDFLKAVSAFIAAAAVLPETLASQLAIDWDKWNEFELRFADGAIQSLIINGRDCTANPEARGKLAELMEVRNDGVFVGDVQTNHGTVLVVDNLPDTFTMGFHLKTQPSGVAACAVNGTLLKSASWVSDVGVWVIE